MYGRHRTDRKPRDFKKLVLELGLDVAPSFIANSYLEGKEAAQKSVSHW
jgi:hypothetical protein